MFVGSCSRAQFPKEIAMNNVFDIKTGLPINHITSPETKAFLASLSDEEVEELLESLSGEL
jgi:hypothetical protein